METQQIVEREPPCTFVEMVREWWFWRQHKRRIAAGIRKNFRPLHWQDWPRFPRPITAILYERGEIRAYKDGEQKWWDFS